MGAAGRGSDRQQPALRGKDQVARYIESIHDNAFYYDALPVVKRCAVKNARQRV